MDQLIEACRDKTVDEIESALLASRHAEKFPDARAVAECLAACAAE